MNETLNIIASRYSCRSYDRRLPEREKLDAIALAAIQSPSGMNEQPWQIIVITDKFFLEEMDAEGIRIISSAKDKSTYDRIMGRGGKLFYNAPCMFLILKQTNADIDCGIVSQNISLAATSVGLGSVICGMASIPFSGEKGESFKKRIGFSKDWKFGIAVLVGYAIGEGNPHTPDTSKICYVERTP